MLDWHNKKQKNNILFFIIVGALSVPFSKTPKIRKLGCFFQTQFFFCFVFAFFHFHFFLNFAIFRLGCANQTIFLALTSRWKSLVVMKHWKAGTNFIYQDFRSEIQSFHFSHLKKITFFLQEIYDSSSTQRNLEGHF